jgi:hypothetical protein
LPEPKSTLISRKKWLARQRVGRVEQRVFDGGQTLRSTGCNACNSLGWKLANLLCAVFTVLTFVIFTKGDEGREALSTPNYRQMSAENFKLSGTSGTVSQREGLTIGTKRKMPTS